VTIAGEAEESVRTFPDAPAAVGSRQRRTRKSQARPRNSRLGRLVTEYAILIVSALVLASLIRAFLGLAFWIPSESMLPTLQVGDRVVVSRLSYRLHPPARGDIVVFENPGWKGDPEPILPIKLVRNLGEFVGVGQPKERNYIKRVIGLPGDTVEGKDGKVFVNGKALPEPYLPPEIRTDDFSEVRVPAGKYWMMGDNRGESCDSRCFVDPEGNPAPFVAKDKLVGRAFVRVYPFNRVGKP
jgi:signal peptidase I